MPGIINGRSWLNERRAFLQGELARGPSDDQRTAIEAELAALEPELASANRRWWRWLFFGSRPPG